MVLYGQLARAIRKENQVEKEVGFGYYTADDDPCPSGSRGGLCTLRDRIHWRGGRWQCLRLSFSLADRVAKSSGASLLLSFFSLSALVSDEFGGRSVEGFD